MKKLFALLFAVALTATVLAQSTFVSKLPLAPKAGATVMGIVETAGKPLAGVAVSDGYQITTTDSNGCYYLSSEKVNGSVFVTSPSGYDYEVKGAQPLFWAALTKSADKAERHDFSLTPRSNDNHVMLAITDIHLSNQYNDVKQFQKRFIPSVKATVKKYGSTPVYTMNMGDSSFDLYWYDFNYSIADFPNTLRKSKYPTPVFSTMGNHDNDGATPCDANTDFNASKAYRAAMGPRYYSFNIGKVHYIMLDNIVYLNEAGGKKGKNIVGKRNYHHEFTAEQLAWLRKDLALVADKNTPIVIGMHDPVFHYKGLDTAKFTNNFFNQENLKEFISTLAGFNNIHFLDGHSHKYSTTRVDSLHIVDHNVSAVCGSWWRTGDAGHDQFGPDGSPAAYKVFEIDGQNLKWYHNSIDDGCQQQFRTFDMNEVKKYSEASKDYTTFISHYPKRHNFCKEKPNKVYLCIWGWEPTWKVSVTENGKPLEAKHARLENPQYTYCYDILRTVKENTYPEKYGKSGKQLNMFLVQCSDADSDLQIDITDSFGQTWSQTMARPKAFTPDTK